MNPYLIGGGVAAIAVLGFLLKGSYERNGELEALLASQVAETEECVSANGSNIDTINRMEKTIVEMIERRRVEQQERERVLAQRERELVRAQARADQLERERENEIATNEDCADLTSLRVGVFCPATADQLRKRSRGAGGDEDGDGGDSG